MLKHIPTNKIYKNRKEIRNEIGIYEYKRECKRGNIKFLNDDEDK